MFGLDGIRHRFRRLSSRQVEASQLQQLQTELLEESVLSASYVILIVGSCAIATLGLLANSTAVIIGAMIIAPLMLPIRGLALISGSLAGTAIAVALMPPICVIGLGLSRADWSLSLGASLLYLTNLLGITLSCMLTFLLTGCTPLRRAKKALSWTIALTSTLLIPLSIGFAELIRQSRLEDSLQAALVNRTVTFQRIELLDIDTNWLTQPPRVRLSVRAQEPVTPKQVQLLEAFVEREMGQPFTLIFTVSQVEEVTREGTRRSTAQQKLGTGLD